MKLKERSVREVVELLRGLPETRAKACLLIGAGVSFTAGIPLADGFVAQIRDEYPANYARACEEVADGGKPNYAQCMGRLPPRKQVQLVRGAIEKAKINWGHIGIARLERAGIVDAILTPSFDPLAARACALFNRFPAVYDLAGLGDNAANQINFDKSYVEGSAIFHLHGQHSGFKLLNTTEKLQEQALRIRPVLEAVMRGKPVIIAGYSGENDPLIDQIAALAPFNHGLFWVRHDDSAPVQDVCEKLLSLDDCYVVRNMPSDRFFTELANELSDQPPAFLVTPFAHMLNVLDTIRPYSDILDAPGPDLLGGAIDQLKKAEAAQKKVHPDQAEIATLWTQAKYQEVWDRYGHRASTLTDADQKLIAWSAIMIGNALADQAKTKKGEEADALWRQAAEKYDQAISIKPDMPEALHNWGNALDNLAKTKKGEQADTLWRQAAEKYAQALAIKPDNHETLNNWGTSLSAQAETKKGEEADGLWRQAAEKYAQALAIKPDMYGALNNWGLTLDNQARTKKGEEADTLWRQAEDKYRRGEKILSGSCAYNLSCVSALRGDAAGAADWLIHSKAAGVDWPGCEHLYTDTDFDGIRSTPEFVAALARIGC